MRRSVARWNAAFMRQKGCQKKFALLPHGSTAKILVKVLYTFQAQT